MKKIIIVIAVAAMALSACSSASKSGPKSQADSLSYVLGIDYGQYLKAVQKQVSDEIDINQVSKAIDDVMKDKATMTSEDAYNYLSNYFTVILPQQLSAKEQEFLASVEKANKKAIKTESGLLYEVIKEGTGAKPLATDKVEVIYTGTLTDGTVFDSNKESGDSITFALDSVIPGWTEGLQLIGEGGTIKLWIPAALGYGANGTPDGSIGPYQPLIFEVELIKVNPEVRETY